MPNDAIDAVNVDFDRRLKLYEMDIKAMSATADAMSKNADTYLKLIDGQIKLEQLAQIHEYTKLLKGDIAKANDAVNTALDTVKKRKEQFEKVKAISDGEDAPRIAAQSLWDSFKVLVRHVDDAETIANDGVTYDAHWGNGTNYANVSIPAKPCDSAPTETSSLFELLHWLQKRQVYMPVATKPPYSPIRKAVLAIARACEPEVLELIKEAKAATDAMHQRWDARVPLAAPAAKPSADPPKPAPDPPKPSP